MTQRAPIDQKQENQLTLLHDSIQFPELRIAALPVDGRLRMVGRSTVLSTRVGRELGRQLRPSQPGYPWPEEISETSLNRFSEDKGPIRLTLVDPLVIEVAADVPGPVSPSAIPQGSREVERLHEGQLPHLQHVDDGSRRNVGVAELAAEGCQRGGPGRS